MIDVSVCQSVDNVLNHTGGWWLTVGGGEWTVLSIRYSTMNTGVSKYKMMMIDDRESRGIQRS